MWVSFNDGASWQTLQLNLPPVPVHDLAIKEGDLIAATHGRSFWIIDDLSPLRQLTPAVTASASHLFKPRDAYRVSFAGRGFGGGGGANAGQAGPPVHPVATSPAGGPVVNFWLKQAGREVTLDFLDAQGKLIRSFTSKQDSATAADSVRRASRTKSRTDSLVAAGISVDSARAIIRRTPDAQSESDTGGEDERSAPRRSTAARAEQGGNQQLRVEHALSGCLDVRGADHVGCRHAGPVAPPGTYQVRMSVDGKPVGDADVRAEEGSAHEGDAGGSRGAVRIPDPGARPAPRRRTTA